MSAYVCICVCVFFPSASYTAVQAPNAFERAGQPPKIAHSHGPVGDLDSYLIYGSLGPLEWATQTASRSVQTFLPEFPRHQHTHTQIDHAACDICGNMRCGLIISNLIPRSSWCPLSSSVDSTTATLFYSLPQSNMGPLRRVQNAATRVTLGLPPCDNVRPALKELHWLPVAHRIQYKVALLMFMVHDNRCPVYLSESVQPVSSNPVRQRLRSEKQPRLHCSMDKN